MKKLSILVPHYKESESVIKPLLDSVEFQQNIDFADIEVIICDDGPEALELSSDFLNHYTYDIQYHREPKGGVSKMRNTAFSYSSGDYVMWCDADDQLYHCLAIWFVLNETKTPVEVVVNGIKTTSIGYDALYSVFLEEGRNPLDGSTYFIDRKDGFQFVHGKVFKRDFLVKNDIHFFDECTIHEDNVLNLQVQSCTEKIKWCPVPFYLWKWRDDSICRRDPLYLLKTYIDLIKSSDCSISWLIKKSKFDKARECVCSIVYDSYYAFNSVRWKEVKTKEYRDLTEKRFAEYFVKYEYLWNEAPKELKMAISNGIRQREVSTGMEMEEETLDQYLKRIKTLI